MRAGAILRQLRALTHLSQRELAERAGLSRSVVGRLEADGVQPSPLQRCVETVGYQLIPVPRPEGISSELRNYLATVPLDERVERVLSIRGARDIAEFLGDLPSIYTTVLLGELAQLAWSLPTPGPAPRLVLGVPPRTWLRRFSPLTGECAEFCAVTRAFARQCAPSNEWQPRLSRYVVPTPYMLAIAGIDTQMLAVAQALDAERFDRAGRVKPAHRTNEPEQRLERERFRLNEWGPGERASRNVLDARERRAWERNRRC
jgi:hypothetical protein